MKQTDKKEKGSESGVSLDKEKLTVEAGLSTADYYRVLIWNSIVDVTNADSLRYLVNAAMTFSHRERAGCFDTTRNFSEFIASEEETERFLSEG